MNTVDLARKYAVVDEPDDDSRQNMSRSLPCAAIVDRHASLADGAGRVRSCRGYALRVYGAGVFAARVEGVETYDAGSTVCGV